MTRARTRPSSIQITQVTHRNSGVGHQGWSNAGPDERQALRMDPRQD
jgi:hypothetical protein